MRRCDAGNRSARRVVGFLGFCHELCPCLLPWPLTPPSGLANPGAFQQREATEVCSGHLSNTADDTAQSSGRGGHVRQVRVA
jgi:hypothetical protein